jgi:murein DD-endopeptidase MepM/ murein hydrolase activator NlpD
MANLTIRAFICISIAIFTVSCSHAEGPRLGMKFEEPYSALFGGGFHDGLDLDVPRLTPVTSIGDGTVAQVLNPVISGQPTNIVVIRHEGGYLSRYLHIDRITVKRGDEIKRGQQFAVVELNGPAGPFANRPVTYPHLHLEVIFKDRLIDPQSLSMTCGASRWRWPVGCKN